MKGKAADRYAVYAWAWTPSPWLKRTSRRGFATRGEACRAKRHLQEDFLEHPYVVLPDAGPRYDMTLIPHVSVRVVETGYEMFLEEEADERA